MLKSFGMHLFNLLPDHLVFPQKYFDAQRCIVFMRNNASDVKRMQRSLLAQTLRDALSNVPFYQKNIKIHTDINADNAFEVLQDIPFLEKKEIMKSPESFVSNRYKISSLTIGTSGGSTGQGVQVYTNYTQRVVERAFFDYQWNAIAGWKRSSPLARIGCNAIKKSDQSPFSRLGNKLLISPYHFNEQWLPAIAQKIHDEKIQYFHAYPSSFEKLISYMYEKGIQNHICRGIFLASERITEHLLDIIPEVFPESTVVFHYGLTERSNLAWGCYKNEKISYILEPAYGISENYINEKGQYEIVGTCFWNDVMPLIRYRTQDYGRIENGIIEHLDGREQDFLIARDNSAIPGFSISIAKPTWKFIENFQVVQNVPGKLEFHVVPRHNKLTPDEKEQILSDQKAKWGGFFEMKVVEIDHIEKTKSGKTKLIQVNLNH